MPKITSGDHPEKGLLGTQPSRSNSSDRLTDLESNIRKGQSDYVLVGSALTEIQSARLYKGRYNTFEEYCEKQWGLARQTVYDYIHASVVGVRLSVQNPPAFKQAVELSRLEPADQQRIANQLDFQTATVKDVKAKVDAFLGKPSALNPPEPKEITLEAALDALVLKIVMQPYGYYAAKFSKYAFQHTTDLAIIDHAKCEIYRQILLVCERKIT